MARTVLPATLVLLAVALTALGQGETNPCPTVFVTGPSHPPKPLTLINFSVAVSNIPPSTKLTYKWLISSGTIVAGQKTSRITVRTSRRVEDENITATVEIGGLPTGCSDHYSETAPVANTGLPEPKATPTRIGVMSPIPKGGKFNPPKTGEKHRAGQLFIEEKLRHNVRVGDKQYLEIAFVAPCDALEFELVRGKWVTTLDLYIGFLGWSIRADRNQDYFEAEFREKLNIERPEQWSEDCKEMEIARRMFHLPNGRYRIQSIMIDQRNLVDIHIFAQDVAH